MKDHFGRTIDYLRISLTDRCNLRCIYCMSEEGVEQLPHEDILRMEEVEQVVRVAAELGISRVRLTGGEPLVRRGAVDLIAKIKSIPGIQDLSLTTNGILLPAMSDDLKAAGLDRVNISLDTLDPEQFALITRRGKLEDTLAGIEAALSAGFDPVKINVVAVRSLSQDYLAFAKLSLKRPLHVRFIEYMPVGESSGGTGCGWGVEDVISVEEIRDIIDAQAQAEGLAPLVAAESARPLGGGPAQYYEFPGAQGTVGFISAMSDHFCSQCNRLRLTADGRLRACLFSDEEYDVKRALRSGDKAQLRAVFERVLAVKPDAHHHRVGTQRGMSQIGG